MDNYPNEIDIKIQLIKDKLQDGHVSINDVRFLLDTIETLRTDNLRMIMQLNKRGINENLHSRD